MQSHGVFHLIDDNGFDGLEVVLNDYQMTSAADGIDPARRTIDNDIAEIKIAVFEEHLRL